MTITTAEVLALCRLEATDTQAVADVNEVMAREQAVIEGRIASVFLADAALANLLRRGVAKWLASEVLAMRRREDGAASAFQGAGVMMGATPDHGAILRAEAEALLRPYLRPLPPPGRSGVIGAHFPS